MKASVSSRLLHNWVSVALVLPLFIIGMSTFFMTHGKSIGSFVIGYSNAPLELKDMLHTPGGRRFLATKDGVYQLQDGKITPVEALQNHEIRVLELLDDGRVLAAGKLGLWLGAADDHWEKIYDADIHGVQILPQSWYLMTKEKGVLISKDQGQSWKSDSNIEQSLAAMSGKKPVLLGKFMNDLHTGKAIMAKNYEWIWADLLALVLVFLALTGVYMWWKTQKRKHGLK